MIEPRPSKQQVQGGYYRLTARLVKEMTRAGLDTGLPWSGFAGRCTTALALRKHRTGKVCHTRYRASISAAASLGDYNAWAS